MTFEVDTYMMEVASASLQDTSNLLASYALARLEILEEEITEVFDESTLRLIHDKIHFCINELKQESILVEDFSNAITQVNGLYERCDLDVLQAREIAVTQIGSSTWRSPRWIKPPISQDTQKREHFNRIATDPQVFLGLQNQELSVMTERLYKQIFA